MTKEEFFALGGTQENFSDPNFNVVEFVESLEGINDFLIQKEIEQEYWTFWKIVFLIKANSKFYFF